MTVNAAILVYESMLLPILEYGDEFLLAATVINRKQLQSLQNKGLGCALGKGLETSNSVDPKMLKARRAKCKTRASNKKMLKSKRPSTEKFKKSLAYNGPKSCNKLPAELQITQPKAVFKIL